jgi:hypothetical protein
LSLHRVPRLASKILRWLGLPALFLLVIPAALVAGTFPAPDDIPNVEPVRTGAETVIATGAVEGINWVLKSYPSNEGLCLELDLTGAVNADGGGCGFNLSGESVSGGASDHVVGGVLTTIDESNVSFIYGPFTKKPTDEGEIVIKEVDIIIGGPALPPPQFYEVKGQIDYYMLVVPQVVNGAVITALDTRDQTLDQVTLGGVDG